MIAFTCPYTGCAQKLTIKDEFAGKIVTCPKCKQHMQAPAAPAAVRKGLDFLSPPQGPGELGRLGPYRIVRVLGEGSMGVVLQAEDPVLKRSVAVKVMRPDIATTDDARQRFLREAQAMAAIEHSHIIHIYQVGQDRDVPFLAMPFLKGEGLDQRLKREKKLPAAEVVSIARQVAEGLAAAHAHGLIHRDIKPSNIWLEPPGERAASSQPWVKILDFGLVRPMSDKAELTLIGTLMGTPAFMSPEQARGEKADARSDLFSLGSVVYHLLTGELPFKETNVTAMLRALTTKEPRPLQELRPETPPALADLVKQLLAKDAAVRPTAAQAADALAKIEENLPDADDAAQGEKARPRWLLRAAGGGSLLGLLVLAIWIISARANWSEKEIENSIGMKLVRIPAGTFTMGSPPEEEGRDKKNEAAEKQHEVEITKEFWLGVHEVTQEQFQKVMGYNPSYFSRDGEGKSEWTYEDSSKPAGGKGWVAPDTSDLPVENVSHEEAEKFCLELTKKEGGSSRKYRLPSEAEWEYACRAGADSYQIFHFGNSLSSNQANFDDRDPQKGIFLGRTLKGGCYKANGFGLFDMHGNVAEWCADWSGAEYYGKSPRRDPPGPSEGKHRVYRGGAWSDSVLNCRSANRYGNEPAYRYKTLGFRVVLDLSGR